MSLSPPPQPGTPPMSKKRVRTASTGGGGGGGASPAAATVTTAAEAARTKVNGGRYVVERLRESHWARAHAIWGPLLNSVNLVTKLCKES